MCLNSEYNEDQFKPFRNHAKTLLVRRWTRLHTVRGLR
jgi:hypothetical protein